MSAIAGLWRFDGKPEPAGDCARMLAAQQIYGPHDERSWSDGPLAMGRRLFRTLPEDEHDRQPLQSRDGRLTLVADVRLDNREELTQRSACRPATLGNSATLLSCLKVSNAGAKVRSTVWSAISLLRCGMRMRRSFCWRAISSASGRCIIIAGKDFSPSPPCRKVCTPLPKFRAAPDEQMVAEFLALMPQRGPRSFFKDICARRAGSRCHRDARWLSSRHYWHPQRRTAGRATTGDYVEGLRHHLDQAVQSRLRGANGAVGAHLSAGFDSGAVTATAARLLAPSGGKVIAFTAVPRQGYDGPIREIASATRGRSPPRPPRCIRTSSTF